jgi:hypothetical protein
MPLQNRVTPEGEILALAGRGTLMGNRGVLHDANRRIVRVTQVKRWIACVLEYHGIRRTLMKPNSYTELFFLDEATAFAAGHRPCAECRRGDYTRFRSLWESRFGRVRNVDEIDAVLHAERLDGKRKRTFLADVPALPDGTCVRTAGASRIVWRGTLAAWSDRGYHDLQPLAQSEKAEVLTPPSIIEVFRAGYVPGVHRSLSDALGNAHNLRSLRHC